MVIGPAIGASSTRSLHRRQGVPNCRAGLENATPVILGVLLVIQMLVAPNGIVGQFKDIQANGIQTIRSRAEVHNGATPVERLP